MNLSNDQKKLLMEFLRSHYALTLEDIVRYRNFDTWQDLEDCVSALRKAGLWSRFEEFAFVEWHKQSIMKMTTLTDYLLRPTDEKGEPHFCRLVADFLEARK